MTEQTQPTDAEILDAVKHLGAAMLSPVEVARAVLAKWGTPAGAGEPTEAMIDAGNRARLYREHGDLREEAVLSARTHNTRATWFAMCEAAPQHTQVQAGAVPLTRYRVLEPRVDRIEADDEYLQDDAQTWATDPNGTFVGTIYGYALRAARRRIKGADHD